MLSEALPIQAVLLRSAALLYADEQFELSVFLHQSVYGSWSKTLSPSHRDGRAGLAEALLELSVFLFADLASQSVHQLVTAAAQ